jgi:glycopeptide antibiotics resistance protein
LINRLRFIPYPLLVGLGTLLVLLFHLRWRKKSISYIFFFSFFWMYMLMVAGMTLFPIPLDIGVRTPLQGILGRMNLRPLYFGGLFSLHTHVILQQIIGNILLTIPFGFGINFLMRIKARHFPWVAVGTGMAIEISQLAVSLGIGAAYRGVDINDVLLNAVGALIGYVLFRAFGFLYLALVQYPRKKPNSLYSYIYWVARRV